MNLHAILKPRSLHTQEGLDLGASVSDLGKMV